MSTTGPQQAGPAAGRSEAALPQQPLLDWFQHAARSLPWRDPAASPWSVLVSEIMLQQTPVQRVEPIWRDWLHRWPRPSALAAASQAEVIRAWGKLGYPRRALRLHECAGVLAQRHGDEVPADVDRLLELPGIGSYTARAVAAFAYRKRCPVIDTNVRRVITRAEHGRQYPAGSTTTGELAELEDALPRQPEQAATFSAAVMELGALVCTSRSPRCGECPIAGSCRWLAAGKPETDPAARPRAQRFAGTDRQVRGLIMDVLRRADGPVDKARLDVVWSSAGQREHCLDSLLTDGLVEQDGNHRFSLPGELSAGG